MLIINKIVILIGYEILFDDLISSVLIPTINVYDINLW